MSDTTDCIHCLICERLEAIQRENGSVNLEEQLDLIMQAVAEALRSDDSLPAPVRAGLVKFAFLALAKHTRTQAQLFTAMPGGEPPPNPPRTH